jgi:hypothetical protein
MERGGESNEYMNCQAFYGVGRRWLLLDIRTANGRHGGRAAVNRRLATDNDAFRRLIIFSQRQIAHDKTQ